MFKGLGQFGDMAKLMKQAQEMQTKMTSMQDELDNIEVTGESGAGLVKVKSNAKGKITGLTIDEKILMPSEKEVIEDLIDYVKAEVKKGTRVNQVMRHTLGLFHGKTGSSHWKRYLSENMCVRDADVKKIDHIMDKVRLSPKLHSAGRID